MNTILNNELFAERFERLAGVRLNPRRHTAANALAHSRAVSAHAVALGIANGLDEPQIRLLTDLGLAHDIGKITGTARPERSLDVLRECGIEDAGFLSLVRWHDTSLPWYLAAAKGQPPSPKAWRRIAGEVDLRLLALFMVADRVDAPPGWRRNTPTIWFLDEARKRGLIAGLRLDLPNHPSEVSAGGAVVREGDGAPELLLIRVRAEGYELPKGRIEWDELPADAALRETREETGIESPLEAGPEIGHLDYPVGDGEDRYVKRVRYFALAARAELQIGSLPQRTRERRWLMADDVDAIPLVSEALRPILVAALETGDAAR
jgi:ADP-ribose pyrophosphatase YjhB (NUDIX family)